MTYEKNLKNNILEGIVIGIVFTALSYGIGVAFGWIDSVNWLEAFAVFTSYVCTWLCVRERRWNYPIGAVSTAAYAVVFWQMELYASAALNAYLVPTLVYGWFRWRQDDNTRPISRVEPKWIPVYLAVTGLTYGAVLLIVGAFDAKLAVTDSVILVGSILAQFLLDNKKIETWFIWAIVNVLAIYTYFNADLFLAGFQYITFLANTVVGYVVWSSSKNAHEYEAGRNDILAPPTAGPVTKSYSMTNGNEAN
jgi:nicotinamide mononucleotide transporter